jgi:tetratricopeptide (TPR) repeat protein
LGEDHPDTAAVLNNLGGLLKEMGDLAGARPYLEQALAVTRRALGEDHPRTGSSLSSLGVLLRDMGDLAGARPYLEQALAVRLRALGEGHPDTATSLNFLGGLHMKMGDLAWARPYLEQALAVRRRALGVGHPETADSLNDLGALLMDMGDLAGARPYLEQALAVRRRALGVGHPETATSLNNLGALVNDMGDLAGARPYYEQALAVHRRALGEDHPDTAGGLNNLGLLLRDMGDLAGARPYLERALAVMRRALGEDHPDTAASLNNLAFLEACSGQPAVAFGLMQQAAAIDDRMIAQVFSTGSDRQRLTFLGKVRKNVERFLSLVHRFPASSSEAVRAAFEVGLRRKALTAEALAAQRDSVLAGRYPHLRGTLAQLTRLRGQVAQKLLSGPGPGEAPDSHLQQLAHWQAEGELLESELARQIPEMDLGRQLRAADRRAVALALPEGIALVEFVRFRVLNFDADAVEGRRELAWDPARYLAFVLPAGQPDQVQMIDLGEAEPIDQMIAGFRNGITGDPASGRGMALVSTAAPATAAGAGLRQAVFDPLLGALGGRTRLLLCPDGDLARLPFEVLPVGANGDRLVDRYRISYLTSGRDVLRFGAAPAGVPAPPLVGADPDFDLGSRPLPTSTGSPPPKRTGFWSRLFGRRQSAATTPEQPSASASAAGAGRCSRDLDRRRAVARLPGTRAEGEQVAALLGVPPWLGGAVLEARLKVARSPRVLHLATHGFFLEDQPHDPNPDRRQLKVVGSTDRLAGANWENPLLRSGLLLAGFNTWRTGGTPPAEAEDGLLTAEEVSGLDLLDTELVVLSACETGLGQVHVGEGVFGLGRAFMLAGAKTLVMSLWKVPDLATALLMERFYNNLLKRGLARDEALRDAQLYTRDATIGQMRGRWLSPDMIDRLSAGDAEAKRQFQDLAQRPDNDCPFNHPRYWGAFICQGDPSPLPPAEARSTGQG